MFLFEDYHQKSKNLFKNKTPPGDPKLWPDEWKKTFYKIYDKDKKTISLSYPEELYQSLDVVLRERLSIQPTTKDSATLSEKQLSTFLYYSCGEFFDIRRNRTRRFHPSGGARYPLEYYVILFKNVDNITPGVYHYSVQNHGLTNIQTPLQDENFFEILSVYDFTANASCMIITTAIFQRSHTKYKERAYRYVLLEAGAVMQTMCLVATTYHLRHLPFGGAIDDSVETLLCVDGIKESVVTTFLLA